MVKKCQTKQQTTNARPVRDRCTTTAPRDGCNATTAARHLTRQRSKSCTPKKEQQAASQPETGSDTGEWQSSADEDWGTDADKMRVYSCPSCGAQLICEETTAATSCPYCGNPTVIPEQFSGILKPDYILPFKLSKEDAVSSLKRHYKGKLLLPKLFRDNNHIEELRGIYVPFWLFDGEAEGSANYMATTTRVFRHGDTEITETSFLRGAARGYAAVQPRAGGCIAQDAG